MTNEFDDVQVYDVNNPPDNKLEVRTDVAVVNHESIDKITQFEIDTQIATAHKFPRSISRFSHEMNDMVISDEDVAASCFYVLPRDKKNIEGPSVRLAEIALSSWGNSRVGSRIIEQNEEFIVAQGVAHDLEKNVYYATEVRRRIRDKFGKKYSPDMILVTSNAACSIAARNAIFKIVPRAYIEKAYKLAKKTAIGDVKTLEKRREDALIAFNKMGISKERVLTMLNVSGAEDITTDDLGVLLGAYNAIKDGEASVEEIFPIAEESNIKLKGNTEATKVSPKENQSPNQHSSNAETKNNGIVEEKQNAPKTEPVQTTEPKQKRGRPPKEEYQPYEAPKEAPQHDNAIPFI